MMHSNRGRRLKHGPVSSHVQLKCRRRKKWKVFAPCSPSVPRRIDLDSPKSFLVHTNIKMLINERTFSMLPPESQYHLLTLLPACDRAISPRDRRSLTLGAEALNNEFFTKSCVEFRSRLAEGEFLRTDDEKSPEKSEEWKRKHFESHWGERIGNSNLSRDWSTGGVLCKTLNRDWTAPYSSGLRRDWSAGRKTINSLSCDWPVNNSLELMTARPRRRRHRFIHREKSTEPSATLVSDISTSPSRPQSHVFQQTQFLGPGRPRGYIIRKRIRRLPNETADLPPSASTSSSTLTDSELPINLSTRNKNSATMSRPIGAKVKSGQWISNVGQKYCSMNTGNCASRSSSAMFRRQNPPQFQSRVHPALLDHTYSVSPPLSKFPLDSGFSVPLAVEEINHAETSEMFPVSQDASSSRLLLRACSMVKLNTQKNELQRKFRVDLRNLMSGFAVENNATPNILSVGGKFQFRHSSEAKTSDISLVNSQPETIPLSGVASETNHTLNHEVQKTTNNGLELLASVSSISPDKLQTFSDSMTLTKSNSMDSVEASVIKSMDVANYSMVNGSATEPSGCVNGVTKDGSTSNAENGKHVRVYCIRRKSPTDVENGNQPINPSSPALLNIVRTFMMAGGKSPQCGILPRSPESCAMENTREGVVPASRNRRSEEIACSSLLFLQSSTLPPVRSNVKELS